MERRLSAILAADVVDYTRLMSEDQEGTLEAHLPFHVRQLPYYRRLLAAGMANSLKGSLARSGLDNRSSREWLSAGNLPALIG